jgi:hypothetical protein
VKLDTFDKNWTDEFRAQFKTKPAEWRQQDRQGKALVSWYGGDYQPACMSNPDWRAYQRAMVRQSLETGHDGIFFDNPTVHPQGCYCDHCMHKFEPLIAAELRNAPEYQTGLSLTQATRQYAISHPKDFLRFRSTIARDFLDDIRRYARTIKPNALITCNNSLNAPSVFYSQCRTHGYNIHEMSKVEDFVVVEDQNTQPRTEANGQTIEYGPTYKQLHAISHGKPVVAVTIAGTDYHTAPNLMRLAMAEAVANNASYLSWPTWPAEQRERMIKGVRPQVDFLRRNEELFNAAPLRADVVLFLPFRRWVDTDHCVASNIAAALTKANVQFRVVCEDNFDLSPVDGRLPVPVLESQQALTWAEQPALKTFEKAAGHVVTADKPDWLQSVQKLIKKPSVEIKGPATIRAVVHDQPNRTIVHLYNLNIQRLSSFEDKVTPATNVQIRVTVPFEKVRSVKMESADEKAARATTKYNVSKAPGPKSVDVMIADLAISALVVIER